MSDQHQENGSASDAAHLYISKVRKGLAASAHGKPGERGQVTLGASLLVDGQDIGGGPTIALTTPGAGDLITFDIREVIRTDPEPNTSDFEPNYFPLIEFDLPDFPWLLSNKQEGQEGIDDVPALILVTVRDREGVHLERGTPGKLVIDDAGKELPSLRHASVWAHSQVMAQRATSPEDRVIKAISGVKDDAPFALNLSRLISPRRLQPNTNYIAAVVPVFRSGTRGLPATGRAPDSKFAWDESTVAISLPAYYYWNFATSTPGDFEELASRLKPMTPSEAGLVHREFSVSLPTLVDDRDICDSINREEGYVVPTVLSIPVDRRSGSFPELPTKFEKELVALLDFSQKNPALPAKFAVRPPLYGARHAAYELAAMGANAAWLKGLNTRPDWRIAAAIGGDVVRRDQESLMRSAWRKLGDLRKANRLILQFQLGIRGSNHSFAVRLGLAKQPNLTPNRRYYASAEFDEDDHKHSAIQFLILSYPTQLEHIYSSGGTGSGGRRPRGLARLADQAASLADHLKDLPPALFEGALRRALRPRRMSENADTHAQLVKAVPSYFSNNGTIPTGNYPPFRRQSWFLSGNGDIANYSPRWQSEPGFPADGIFSGQVGHALESAWMIVDAALREHSEGLPPSINEPSLDKAAVFVRSSLDPNVTLPELLNARGAIQDTDNMPKRRSVKWPPPPQYVPDPGNRGPDPGIRGPR